MEGRGIFWDERENQGEIGPRWALQSVLEGGNENSLGQIPRETSDYWTSNRTVRHTLAHTHTQVVEENGGFPGGCEGRIRYNWITNEFIGNGN